MTVRRRIQAATAAFIRRPPINQCLVADHACAGQIVRAHALQRSGILEALSESGHVYMFTPRVGRGMTLSLVGIGDATVFTGFCKHHDRTLFREIDFDAGESFDPASLRQAVLLAFRAVACEYWKKLNARVLHATLLERQERRDVSGIARLLNLEEADARDMAGGAEYTRRLVRSFDQGIARLSAWFASLRSQLRNGSYHLSRHVCLDFAGPATVAASAVFTPWFDASDEPIRPLRPGSPAWDLALTALPGKEKTHLSFLHHRRWTAHYERFFRVLASARQEDREVAVSKWLVLHCENTVYSPRFIDTLDQGTVSGLASAFEKSIDRPLPLALVPTFNVFRWAA